ncbi:unnamed protein product [Sphagnum troendelagicum]|uniref:P-loop containing nucleoside triphosphate hydrolase n=1 Tax=Sphagnum troendelagicum TaxID=128251 RepID=A0ABP0TA28_9BRYO
MADKQKLLYVLVEDDDAHVGLNDGEKPTYHRYTRPLLQSTLQLMGCKPRHALKISAQAFEDLRSELPPKKSKRLQFDRHIGLAPLAEIPEIPKREVKASYDANGFRVNPKPVKKRSTVTVSREKFLNVVCKALAQYQYLGPKQRADLMVACRLRERKTSVTVLLCGTSGCGKSTLASLLGHRLGVTTVVSTDSVRHMMRGFVSEKENPLLWASTYHAGEFLDPEAVFEAHLKKKDTKQASLPIRTSSTSSYGRLTPATSVDESSLGELASEDGANPVKTADKGKSVPLEDAPHLNDDHPKLETADSLVGAKTMAVQGFKAQSEMVMDSLDRLITSWETKKESVVVEGVHLSLNFVMGLMKKHPSIIPFMVYIANEGKHMERFAVRAKYMTLDPAKNKYVKYIRNIRTIQEYLCLRADKHLVPKINNTNVDKSVAAIHATVFSCLRRREEGEPLLDQATNTVKVVHQEYLKQYTSSALGSKSMFQLIQRKGSSRNMLAIVNNDGTVAKAWPLLPLQIERQPMGNAFIPDRMAGTPLYGPLSIGRSHPVNLPFGSLGLSVWPGDKAGSSEFKSSTTAQSSGGEGSGNDDLHASHLAGLGPDKELTEEIEVSDSEEEIEEEEEGDVNDGEDSESGLEPVDEDEGSVDDESVRSDGDVSYIDVDEDDAYWDDEVGTPTPRPPTTGKSKLKGSMSRLRSFDQAAAGRPQPLLRKSMSHLTRVPSHDQAKADQ